MSARPPSAETGHGTPGEEGERLGLHSADAFVTMRAPPTWPEVARQGLWYFRDETVALPTSATPVAQFGRRVRAFDDVRAWCNGLAGRVPRDAPPLVWIAAPDRLADARIVVAGARLLTSGGETLDLALAARHRLNRSWLDASSFGFLAQHPVSLRGTRDGSRFVMRTAWPGTFALDDEAPERNWAGEDPAQGLRALMREAPRGGAESPFAAFTLWRRPNACGSWSGKAVLAFIANGAQGDDDEAHAGHFAIVTGRVPADRSIDDWIVNNFYPLDTESEKAILPAPVPLDNYMGDVNAGQSWYRPSHILIAVLDRPRAAELVQSALGRVYQQFWRHQLLYYHPRVNCTSISVDTLDALGWALRRRGAAAPLLARLGLPLLMLRERGIPGGLRACDYLCAEATRLLPAAAFEEIGASLWRLAHGTADGEGVLPRWLAEDLQALALLRIPQFPSTRAWGDAPVVSLSEYRARLPRDPRDYVVVPVPDRPFPPELRDDDLLPATRTPAQKALLAWIAAALGTAAFVVSRALG